MAPRGSLRQEDVTEAQEGKTGAADPAEALSVRPGFWVSARSDLIQCWDPDGGDKSPLAGGHGGRGRREKGRPATNDGLHTPAHTGPIVFSAMSRGGAEEFPEKESQTMQAILRRARLSLGPGSGCKAPPLEPPELGGVPWRQR
ncbi:hypothetical protein AAFF_G00090860 [Aldrovandia affinis]|uniref:Uncharacterized protein n=1 Tax=Aldrovandia affinis TaxID=143900 RepID=A0AAD7RVU5_9TELE|nr:hypothetical protein AAFF_G00090860 [Aldrovandia affinis]